MKKLILFSAILITSLTVRPIHSNELKSDSKGKVEQGGSVTEEESSVTDGQILLNGKKISYKATAGTYQFKDEHGKPKGRFFYIAYTRSDVENAALRPIAFSFNGGPGASSVWMHMGLLGPKRVALKDGAAFVPPFHFEDNPYSLLDSTDLVFIDPISTGYSRAVPGEDPKEFHSLEGDVKSVGEFIRLYTTRNDRWESPKYLTELATPT